LCQKVRRGDNRSPHCAHQMFLFRSKTRSLMFQFSLNRL
jgi:hypothetical protein